MGIEQTTNKYVESLQSSARAETRDWRLSFGMAGGLAVGAVTSVVLGPENAINSLCALGMAAGSGFLVRQGLSEQEVVADINETINRIQSGSGQQG